MMDQQQLPTNEKPTGAVRNAQGIAFMIEEIKNDPHKLAFAVGVFVGLLTLILIFMWSRGRGGLRRVRRAVLIVGPSDAGKTLLFGQLLHGKPIETYTSMIENVGKYFGTYETDDESSSNVALHKPLDLCDLPGHDRLREAALDKRKEEAKAIIYVVDASTIKQKLLDSADFLFKILADPSLHSADIPILVVCNKQDVELQAKGARVIERELAKEIGKLRDEKAQSRDLQDSSGTSNGNVRHTFLGKEGKDFEFSDLRAKVEFCEASGINDCNDEVSGVPRIKRWIKEIA